MECKVCLEVLKLYNTTESVAPWLCECPRSHKFESQTKATKQKNIYGCCGPFKTKTLKRTGRQLEYCDCL